MIPAQTNQDFVHPPCEVQITNHRPERAYAVYVIGAGGCEYSQRFEYDADDGIRADALLAAVADYKRQLAERPGCNRYNDL